MSNQEPVKLPYEIETHFFTTMKYKNAPDSGFTSNLLLLLEAVKQSDKVNDENLKLIATGILRSVIHHDIRKMDEDELSDYLSKVRQDKQNQEEMKKKEEETKIEEIVEENF
tara:strand:+ start:559 stop:894 length:336 start_codon:yes stop_codon:yes gene_type:complete